jgi:hypothetical protein
MMTGKNWNCGIYCIRNTVTGECYVGQSKQVFGRWYSHFERLANGKHVCPKFQKSFDAFSAAAFTCEILELCEPSKLTEREFFNMCKHRPTLNEAVPDYDAVDLTKEVIAFSIRSAGQREEAAKRQERPTRDKCACGLTKKVGNRCCYFCMQSERRDRGMSANPRTSLKNKEM